MDIERLLCEKAKIKQYLIRCIVELSPLCNLSCEMCGISLKKEDVSHYGHILNLTEWINLIDQLYEYGVLNLVFSGGEPLMYPGFKDIYSYAYSKGFLIEIRTNGLLIPQFEDLFRKMPPKQIGISVYGSNDKMYYNMTGEIRGYSRLLESLKIVSTFQSHLHLTCTMTKTNVTCFLEIAELAEKCNASFGMITDIFPHVKGSVRNIQSRLSPAECAALAFYPPVDYQKALDKAHKLELEYSNKFSLDKKTDEDTLSMCNGCQIHACIKWDGRMTFCPEIDTVYAEPLKIGIENAWKQLLRTRDEYLIPSKQCSTCGIRKYCSGACPARFYLETGDYQKPCRHICERAFYTKLLSSKKGNNR